MKALVYRQLRNYFPQALEAQNYRPLPLKKKTFCTHTLIGIVNNNT
jgi:hypothetical protein